ncbi:apoptosis-stimulating of p53 protein 2-like isoform X2 [Anguilla rostrata]|uniref:apoptosis-stimulating of p53 protein 2-like isoform X2 n=1 Tax=Anguilla rostrata TaxID=7938 RepID=UPI0030CEA756
MRYGAKMMPMFLTVYLSNNDQHFTEVPITPETLCRDVVELCKEPGEVDCYLAELWRGSERVVSEAERMLDVLQRWGQQRTEVRFFLRHERAPSRESGVSRGPEHLAKRNGVKGSTDRHVENGVVPPRMDMTLAELQEMASRQQQQIDAQQQLLASKEQRLRYLKQQDQRLQQQDQRPSEQEKLQRLRENAESQEAKLKKVRALRGQVEQKRLSNGKLVEEIEQMNSLFQQKQRELVLAVSKVEDLSRQLEMLKNGKMDSFHDNQSSAAELDRLYKELQLRNKLNQEQNSKLQQQRENLNKRNLEVASMDRRVSELRDRLWKKKAALQQKENVPNGFPVKEKSSKGTQQVPSDGHAPQQGGASRVAAVGPYIPSSTMPRGPARHELLVKPAYPDGTATLPPQDGPLKAQARSGAGPAGKLPSGAGQQMAKVSKFSEWSSSSTESGISHGYSSTLPRMGSHSHAELDDADVLKRDRDKKARPSSMLDASEPSTASLRKNQSSEDLLREAQISGKGPVKVPPPVPSKPKQVTLPPAGLPGQYTYGKPALNTGTFPGKARPANQHPPPVHHRGPTPGPASHSHTLPLPAKQEAPPAAKVRPFTPELPAAKDPALHKPQTVAASSIYSMYTQQAAPTKSFPPALPGTLTRTQPRLYGKPVIPGGPQQPPHPDNPYLERPGGPETEVDHGGSSAPPGEGQETERIPRPLSPTKLLPFISNPYRHQSDVDLEALRKKLYHAPRPLKKRSSITEPEGPAGPNIQKLLYQKTTLAAMETTVAAPFFQPTPRGAEPQEGGAPQAAEPGPAPAPCPADRSESPPAGAPDLPASFEAGGGDIVPMATPSRPAPMPEAPPSVPLTEKEEERWEEEQQEESGLPAPQEAFVEEYPPYPPPPYPIAGEQEGLGGDTSSMQVPEVTGQVTLPPGKRTNLRKLGSERIDHGMRVKFNPLALLLDSSLEGEYDLVQRIIYEVEDPSLPNDEGITALHNAVCAGHTEIVKFLVQFGVNVNAADSDGWTPLHCAASCNNVQVCKFLVESGAAVFATTYSDMQTAADKCEEMEEGYAQCSQFLYGVQEKMGIMNRGVVYALWNYPRESEDELAFREGDCMTVVRREDEDEVEWWWARMGEEEGYIPRNLLGLYPRIKQRQRSLA